MQDHGAGFKDALTDVFTGFGKIHKMVGDGIDEGMVAARAEATKLGADAHHAEKIAIAALSSFTAGHAEWKQHEAKLNGALA